MKSTRGRRWRKDGLTLTLLYCFTMSCSSCRVCGRPTLTFGLPGGDGNGEGVEEGVSARAGREAAVRCPSGHAVLCLKPGSLHTKLPAAHMKSIPESY